MARSTSKPSPSPEPAKSASEPKAQPPAAAPVAAYFKRHRRAVPGGPVTPRGAVRILDAALFDKLQADGAVREATRAERALAGV